MITRNRRTFILNAAGLCATLAIAGRSLAAPALVDDNDTTAKSLGYRSNASSVDASKFPKYAAGQRCANCRFFAGARSDATGTCPMFPGKVVAAEGWCNVYAMRA
ncbi:high-potential iron-sulfur protein [Paraburkholderia sp. CNPSo 3281]|uniref:high-potential iron-sulfur protein n=1 Tax=Paraburkholderia sp. CNPSo 3281 TaxID=2940933 RepID=UPI0020B73051|nr:high-potential iron-sulfur protein [Paraburkholderia sp. CNPSo 3281]MCP3715497.1 high-potential iron-sulfur protein [Paraburkholderia sp. CNPSo 3281]